MNPETILKFKILTDGERNGEAIYIRAADIRRVASIEVKSDSTFLVGTSKMIRGSILFLDPLIAMPTQSVQELPEEVIAALGGAVVVENPVIRKSALKEKE